MRTLRPNRPFPSPCPREAAGGQWEERSRRRALSGREGGAGVGSGGVRSRGPGPWSERPGCGAGRWRQQRRRRQPGRQALGAACGGAASGCSTGCRCSSSPASSAGPTTPMSPSSACVSAAATGGGRDWLPRDGSGHRRPCPCLCWESAAAGVCWDGTGAARGGGVACLSARGHHWPAPPRPRTGAGTGAGFAASNRRWSGLGWEG